MKCHILFLYIGILPTHLIATKADPNSVAIFRAVFPESFDADKRIRRIAKLNKQCKIPCWCTACESACPECLFTKYNREYDNRMQKIFYTDAARNNLLQKCCIKGYKECGTITSLCSFLTCGSGMLCLAPIGFVCCDIACGEYVDISKTTRDAVYNCIYPTGQISCVAALLSSLFRVPCDSQTKSYSQECDNNIIDCLSNLQNRDDTELCHSSARDKPLDV